MANAHVHEGFWTDHSRGPILGHTVTLRAEWGQQLVSAAAILVQVIGFGAWTIIAFALHQYRAKPGLRDEYDAQLQVLLRNTAGAEGAAWNILRHGKTWSGRKPNVWRSAGTLALIPALVYATFVVAGIFVGQIATNSYDNPNVLLQPGACGFVNPSTSTAGEAGYGNLAINISSIASQYARVCYSGAGSIGAVSCSVYAKPTLNYTISFDQPCPIQAVDACFPDEDYSKPITLETGILDSHHDLGVNAPKDDRITLQYSTTCAPLSYSFVDSFVYNATRDNEDTMFGTAANKAVVEYYNFGNLSSIKGLGSLNYTFSYTPVIRAWGVGTLGYTIQAERSFWPHATNVTGFKPSSPFNHTQGDLSLMFLAPNSLAFTEPVEDPMFRTYTTPDPQVYGAAPYVPERNAYLMACSESYEICNPSKQKCTGAITVVPLVENLASWTAGLELNEQQMATASRFASESIMSSMFSAVNGVPDPLLASAYQIYQSGSRPVPNTQWQIEVEGWFQSILAKLQFLFTVYVDIPSSAVDAVDANFIPAGSQSKALAQQCHQQRVTAPANYQSYNLFALILIAVFGVAVPVAAVVITSGHHKLPGVDPKGPAFLSYQAEGKMQLHRMAMEGAGYGGWEGSVNETPRTATTAERLPQVVLEDESSGGHSILRYPKHGIGVDDSDSGSGLMRKGYREISKHDTDTSF